MSAAILSGFRSNRLAGMQRGSAGKSGRNRIEKGDGNVVELDGYARKEIATGNCIVIETPEGGGYGKLDLTEPSSPGSCLKKTGLLRKSLIKRIFRSFSLKFDS